MIEDVSDTGLWIAHYRGAETERTDALFRDPLAQRLAGERGRQIARSMPGARVTSWMTVVRTVVIDNFIGLAVRGGADVVLNLGAGLDTRPYRMELPSSLRWIEVDYQHVIERKERELKGERPHCRLERVSLDLTDAAKRRELLARVGSESRKVVVLTEGVVPYLTLDDAAALARDLHATPSIAGWIVDYFAPQTARMRGRTRLQKKMQNAPFQFFPENWFAFFENLGWRSKEIRYLAEEGKKLGRPIPLPWYYRVLIALRSRRKTPEQRSASLRFAGYVLLERV